MNERIRELVGQAKFMAEETTNKQISANAELNAFAEKFAELIVKECAKTLDDKLANPNGASMAWCDGSDLLEHFGIE